MKIIHLALLLSIAVSSACGQGNQNSNQTVSNQTASTQTKEIELPSAIKNTDYERNPDESLLVLSVNSGGQVFYQDKPLDDAALQKVLAEYDEKHKNDPSTSDTKYPSLYDDKYKSFYLKADAGASFSQIIKVLKAVRASSNKAYVAKFIVKPQKEADEYSRTPNIRYVVKINLGIKEKIDENAPPPRPNPLVLFTKLNTAGKATLNFEPPMEMSELNTRLTKLFKEREQNGVFREGTNEVEKAVILVALPEVKYGDAIKFIDELDEAGAQPIILGDLAETQSGSGTGDGSRSGSGGGQGSGSGNGRGTGSGQGSGTGTGIGNGIGSGDAPPPKPKKP